jgi:protein tyrosine phosphatase (PTP) superfamily phosphohydrolase (DUF442 family)
MIHGTYKKEGKYRNEQRFIQENTNPVHTHCRSGSNGVMFTDEEGNTDRFTELL